VAKVELLVHASDAGSADVLLTDYEAEKADRRNRHWLDAEDLNWLCPKCSERNANTFDECWSCGQPIPENPERCADEEDKIQLPNEMPDVKATAKKRSRQLALFDQPQEDGHRA